MRIALHIFRKDARRLWWEVAVTVGLLAALANLDRRRLDAMPSPMEGLFNLMLPLAWAYLVALVIQEEALVGDCQFWVTRPYPWPALLAAKALFAIAFIHVPGFLADAAILWARDFSPLSYLPQLLWKQLLLAGALTLPAAIAAVTRNIAQFLLSFVAISGAAVSLVTLIDVYWRPGISVDNALLGIVLLALVAPAMAILLLQYARRRTTQSRILGVGAILAASALFLYLPKEFAFALQCKSSGSEIDGSGLSIQIGPRKLPLAWRRSRKNIEEVAIPIVATGMPDASRVGWEQLEFEISGARGGRWKTVALARNPSPEQEAVRAGIRGESIKAEWLMLILDRSVYDKLKDDKATVNGKVAATLLRAGAAVRLAIGGNPVTVPGAGRCSAVLVHDSIGADLLKVVCESPSALPLVTRVNLVQGIGVRVWNNGLGDSGLSVSYPTQTWLSPLNRRQTFFQIADEARTEEGYKWLVPRGALREAAVEIVAEQTSGCAVFNYQLSGFALGDYVVK